MKKAILFSALLLTLVLRLNAQQSKIDSLISVLQKQNEDTLRVNILNRITWQYFHTPSRQNKSMYDLSFPYALEAFRLAEKLNYNKGKAIAEDRLGIIYEYKDLYEQAMTRFFSALGYWEKVGNEQRVIYTYQNIANVYQSLRDYNNQLAIYLKLMKIAEGATDKSEIADLNYNLATAYFNLCKDEIRKGDSIQANLYYKKIISTYGDMLKQAGADKDSIAIINILSQLAYSYDKCNLCEEPTLFKQTRLISLNYYKEALEYNLRALDFFKRKGDTIRESAQYMLIGGYYKNQGNLNAGKGDSMVARSDFQGALNYYEEGLDLARFPHGIANFNMNIGYIYLKLEWFERGYLYTGRALETFRELNFGDGIKECLGTLSVLCEKKHDYLHSLEYYKSYALMKDSVQNLENMKQIAGLNIKYETAKKDKEIADKNAKLKIQGILLGFVIIGLTAVIIIIISGFLIKSRNKKLNEEKKTKKLILDIQKTERTNIADDLHNVSNSIILTQKLINTLSLEFNNNKVKETVDIISNRLESVREYTRSFAYQLMPQSFWTSGLEAALGDFFKELNSINGITALFRHVQLKNRLNKEISFEIFKIVQELTSNILKYGKEVSEIALLINDDNENIFIVLEDDGLGFDKDEILISESIGWKSIKTKVEKTFSGLITIDSVKGRKGNSITIKFPVTLLKKHKMAS